MHTKLHRRFILNRTIDDSGVSGTGIVAEGIEFSDGTAVLHWIVGRYPCTSTWIRVDDITQIHGHDGHTKVEFIDG
jgi:hypothetical protein